MTLLEVIQRSGEYLARREVDSPRLQAELILAHVLGLPRLQLYLNFERTLSEDELTRARELVKRRGNREPLQHILGSTCFCGLELEVSPHALIPRPETEQLAELAWTRLHELVKAGKASPCVLDFGTGAGALAIALAARCPTAIVHALDVSSSALELARRNARRHAVHERIQFHLGALAEAWCGPRGFDLVVSNPPYIPSADLAALQPEVRDHDPHLALDGGLDGLNFYRQLAAELPPIMAPGAAVLLEFGDGQSGDVTKIFSSQNWIVDGCRQDYSGRPRIFVGRTPETADGSGVA